MPGVDARPGAYYYPLAHAQSYLKELHATQTTEVLSRGSAFCFDLHRLPRGFCALRRLDLELDNIFQHTRRGSSHAIDAKHSGDASWLMDGISQVEATLEELRMTLHPDTDPVFLNYVACLPPGHLESFDKLKVLWVPQALLLPHDLAALVRQRKINLTEYTQLPASLEARRILYPTVRIHDYIRELPQHRERLPFFAQVELGIDTVYAFRGLTPTTDVGLWDAMAAQGISGGVVGSDASCTDRLDVSGSEKDRLLFEIALRDRRIRELEGQVAQLQG